MTGAAPREQDEVFSLLGDRPSARGADPLGFDKVAADLAGMVLAARGATPFTLGIEAEWGMGKSSLMERLRDRLDAADGVRTLWFNAWTADEGDVLEGLIKSVLEQMDPSVLRRAARDKRLKSGLRIATGLSASMLGAGSIVDELWKRVSEDPTARNEMRRLVEIAMERWRRSDEGRRLLCVFIDDLDRCSPEIVFKVFEAVKLYLDAPGLAFVMGYHPAIVSQAILRQKLYDEGITPKEYLEKIVQISYRFTLPASDQAEALLEAYVTESRTGGLFADSVRSLVIEHSRRNPRRIKRFINNLILKYRLDPDWAEIGANALVGVQIVDAYFDDFSALLSDRTGRDAIHEFLEYVLARETLKPQAPERGGASWDAVVELFTARGLDPPTQDGTGPELLATLEQHVPEAYLKLADDADFLAVVRMLDDTHERERLAHKLANRPWEPAAPEVAPGFTSDADLAGVTILWIDDDPNAIHPTIMALQRRGARITEARGREEALRLLTPQRQFDLLISDVERKGIRDQGFADVEFFREERLHTGPVIFFTPEITTYDRGRAVELGAEITANPAEVLILARQVAAKSAMPA